MTWNKLIMLHSRYNKLTSWWLCKREFTTHLLVDLGLEELVWTYRVSNGRGWHKPSKLAVILWDRLEDFICGHQHYPFYPHKLNLQIGTMYVEQEMYFKDSDISDTILMQKNMSEKGHVWGMEKTCISNSQMQASTVVLTNMFRTSMV